MQVDHIESVFNAEYWERKEVDNSIDNLMPACRQCNFYKGAFSLEVFRRQMKSLMERVRKSFIFRLAGKYGMVTEKEWDGLFYFEKNFFGKENPIEIYIKPIDKEIPKDSLSEPIIYKK